MNGELTMKGELAIGTEKQEKEEKDEKQIESGYRDHR